VAQLSFLTDFAIWAAYILSCRQNVDLTPFNVRFFFQVKQQCLICLAGTGNEVQLARVFKIQHSAFDIIQQGGQTSSTNLTNLFGHLDLSAMLNDVELY